MKIYPLKKLLNAVFHAHMLIAVPGNIRFYDESG
jgi:hypothetical protein